MNTKLATILLLASASGLAACSKKAPETLPPDPVQTPGPVTPTPGPTTPGGATGAQRQIVFARAALVGVALDDDGVLAVLVQPLRLLAERLLGVGADG